MKFKVKRTSDFFTYRKKTETPKGCIKEKDYFVIELDNFNDLLNFTNNNGEVIILNESEDGLPVLEIYDDYRE